MKMRRYYYFLMLLFIPQFLFGVDLHRPYDPVTVRGETLTLFRGAPVDELFAYAYKDGGWQQIPFQIDEKDGKGNYVFSHEMVRGKWREPKPTEGQAEFSRQDELVFMASTSSLMWNEG